MTDRSRERPRRCPRPPRARRRRADPAVTRGRATPRSGRARPRADRCRGRPACWGGRGRRGLRIAREGCRVFRVRGEPGGHDFAGNRVGEVVRAGLVHLARAVGPDGREHVVRARAGAAREGHEKTAGIVALRRRDGWAASRKTWATSPYLLPSRWPGMIRRHVHHELPCPTGVLAPHQPSADNLLRGLQARHLGKLVPARRPESPRSGDWMLVREDHD